MQLNRVGIFLIAMFLLLGIGFLALEFFVNSMGTFLLIGVIWVAVSIALLIYAWRNSQRAKHDQWLFSNGLKGRATIVSARSNARVNDQPLVNLELDVDVPGQGSRRAAKRLIVSDFAGHRMQPGLVLPVYVNPSDPEDFLLAW